MPFAVRPPALAAILLGAVPPAGPAAAQIAPYAPAPGLAEAARHRALPASQLDEHRAHLAALDGQTARSRAEQRTLQDVAVKLETFPFTRYGMLAGTVTPVSCDAVSDEKKGPIFPARIALDRATIDTAETRTDRRRVIDDPLSPLARYRSEAGRER